MIEVGLLGPVQVPVAEGVAAPGKRVRALVAVLALAAGDGDALTTDELVARVWPAPPPDPQAAVAALLDRLADVLPEGALADGPRLATGAVGSDLDRLRALTGQAEADVRAGEPALGERRLVEALSLWRGSALEDVRDTAYLAAEGTRLDGLRLAALEDRLDLVVGQGRPAEVIDEIRSHLDAHPTRERLWGLLMSALYAAGRRDEAIGVYAEARTVLADELGIEPGEALQQLQAGILHNGSQGPAPGSTDRGDVQPRRRARIPVLVSSTYGREDLRVEVARLLDASDVRLVTLTGIGGSGKSRVATLVATDVQDRFAAVAYLQVTERVTADQLLVEIALALDCAATADPTDGLAGLDASSPCLVVLDNLESLADGPDAVRRLLDASPALEVLVTSRLPLRVAGEHELPVPPLVVPGIAADLPAIAAAASVQLFVDRATSAEPSFRLAGQEHDVAEVCSLLDGLPLAIELAAARAKLGSLDRIIDGLRTSLDLLATGSDSVPERQRAMATAIRWSYDRLTPAGRLVCDRLALFERGFTIEAVEAVCPDVPDVIEALASIVDARLIRQMESRADVRFVVLGTVRAFARERLLARDDLARSRALLAEHLTTRAEESRTRLYGADGHLTQARFDDDAADIAAAVDWALESGRRSVAVEMLLASMDCWVAAGRHNEALGLTVRVLDHVPQRGAEAARLLAAATMLSHQLSDHEQARTFGRLALDVAEPLGDRASAAAARTFLGAELVFAGEVPEGVALAESACKEAEALDLYPLSTQALTVLAIALAMSGDFDGERHAHEAKLAIVRAKGDLPRTADVLNTLAEIAIDDGDGETAVAFASESLGIAERGMPTIARDATITLARGALVVGDTAEAGRRLAAALDQSDRLGQGFAVAQCLRVGGCLAASEGDAEAAVRLFAAAQRLSPSPGGGDLPPEQDLASALAEARTTLGEPGARRAWTLGGGLPVTAARTLLSEVLGRVSSPA